MISGYTIVYFREASESSPVEQFLNDLPARDRAKVFASISLLKEKGFLPFPYSSDIRGSKKLRELRIRISSNAYRVLYFLHAGRKIVLLHAFSKRSEKVSKTDIETAERRMKEYLRREGK